MSFVYTGINYLHNLYCDYYEDETKTTNAKIENEENEVNEQRRLHIKKNTLKRNYHDDHIRDENYNHNNNYAILQKYEKENGIDDEEEKEEVMKDSEDTEDMKGMNFEMIYEKKKQKEKKMHEPLRYEYNTRSKSKDKNRINEARMKGMTGELSVDTTTSTYKEEINHKHDTVAVSPCHSVYSNDSNHSQEERILFLESTIKGLELTINNSKSAKGGYIEEEKVLQNLNCDSGLSFLFVTKFLSNRTGTTGTSKGSSLGDGVPKGFMKFKRHTSSTCKTDIINSSLKILIQIKRYDTRCCYSQIDRHWIDDFLQEIPDLNSVGFMLRNLCEIPLVPGTSLVDKNVGRYPLSSEYYKDTQIITLLTKLNNNKLQILQYVFQGRYKGSSPNYLMGIEYKKEVRVKTTIYRMEDVIDSINKNFSFEIKPRATVITLGNVISMQRKGGDNGLRSSNQLQWKLRFNALSSIISPENTVEYFF